MISEAPIKDGRIYFEDFNIADDSLQLVIQNLNKLISGIDKELTPLNKFHAQVRSLLSDLKYECSRCLKFDSFYGFGSAFNGFRSKKSDIDVVVQLQENGIDQQLCLCKKSLERSTNFRLKAVIRYASVPIITVIHHKTELECDISFSVPAIPRNDVIWNTKLLKAYSDQYPEIAQGFRFLKYILNRTRFGSVRTNGLSTYSHIIIFIYYLTHRRRRLIPHLDPTTFLRDPNQNVPESLCASQMVIDYLKFISCELDSSKFTIDIRTPKDVIRPAHYGSLGQLKIPDPYIDKNLGNFMKEPQLYNFKLYCCRLLHYLIDEQPSNINQVHIWCCDYETFSQHEEAPNLHPDCQPLYQAPIPKRKKTGAPTTRKPVLQTKELLTIVINSTGEELSTTLNQRLCEKSINHNDQIKSLEWTNVLGSTFQDIADSVDTKIPKLQCVVVFCNDSELEKAELLLEYMPGGKDLVVASCLTRKSGAQVYLTTYLNTVSKHTDVTAMKRIYVYNPSYQLPVSLWKILRDTVPGELYFLMPLFDASKPDSEFVDGLARLYSSPCRAESSYVSTVQLAEIRAALLQRDTCFEELPENLELHRIRC